MASVQTLVAFVAISTVIACANGAEDRGSGGNDANGGDAGTANAGADTGAGADGGGGRAAQGGGGQGQAGNAQGGAGQGGAGGGGPCSNEVDGAACYTCCQNQFTIGRQIFEAQFGSCGCGPDTCYLDCNSSICGALNAVDNTCVACIEGEVAAAGACGMAAGFQNGCLAVSDCANFLSCVSSCTP